MMKRSGYLLAPAAVLALSMGCTGPVEPTEDADLDDTNFDTTEQVGESTDGLLNWEDVGDAGGLGTQGEFPDFEDAGGMGEQGDWEPIQGISTQSAPSTAVLGGVPRMAYVDKDNRCMLSSYDDSKGSWGASEQIPGCAGPAVPNLATHGNTLNVGYLGRDGTCLLNAYDGSRWNQPRYISGCSSSFAPAIAPYGNSVSVVYGGQGGGLYHSTCGLGSVIGGCGTGLAIPRVTTILRPALGMWGNRLALAYTGLNRQVYFTNFGGCAGCGWGVPYGIPGAFAAYGPTFGYFGNRFLLGYPGLYGGYALSPYLGYGLGWGRFRHFGHPFFGRRFFGGLAGLGYYGFGPRFGLGMFAPFRGGLFHRGLGPFFRRGWGRGGFWGW